MSLYVLNGAIALSQWSWWAEIRFSHSRSSQWPDSPFIQIVQLVFYVIFRNVKGIFWEIWRIERGYGYEGSNHKEIKVVVFILHISFFVWYAYFFVLLVFLYLFLHVPKCQLLNGCTPAWTGLSTTKRSASLSLDPMLLWYSDWSLIVNDICYYRSVLSTP